MLTENNGYSFSMVDAGPEVRMVVLGVGGMGNNAMENLSRASIMGLDLYSLNTDIQSLRRSRGSKPVQLGAKRTSGRGAGGDSDLGRLSAEDDAEKIKKIVKDAELVFIASGMGGGTGTGAAPVIARICREVGVLSICVVTMPMDCEGMKRTAKARSGLAELRRYVDALLIIENEKLSVVMDREDISIIEVFRRADQVVVDSVAAVARIINSHGYINLDLADLKKVLQRGTKDCCVDAYIGVGEASGVERAQKAAEIALNNPLMREVSIAGAENLLVNVVGSDQMGHKEAMAAIKSIVDSSGSLEKEIFMGVVPDNSMGDKLSITVIATGLVNQDSASQMPGDFRLRGKEAARVEAPTSASNIRIHPKPVKDKSASILKMSESTAVVSPDNDQTTPSRVVEGYGFSPLIRKEEWETPAYLRKQVRSSELATHGTADLNGKKLGAEKSAGHESTDENQTENIRYQDALYHMVS